MSPLMFRIVSLVAIALAAFSVQVKARGEALSDADVRQVQAVVAQQLSAFALDDAAGAFATATPKVREEIGNPDRFLAMVRAAYPMVYRPVLARLQKPESRDGMVTDVVIIRDDADKTWLAMCLLERQPDNTWRISACSVTETAWKTS